MTLGVLLSYLKHKVDINKNYYKYGDGYQDCYNDLIFLINSYGIDIDSSL